MSAHTDTQTWPGPNPLVDRFSSVPCSARRPNATHLGVGLDEKARGLQRACNVLGAPDLIEALRVGRAGPESFTRFDSWRLSSQGFTGPAAHAIADCRVSAQHTRQTPAQDLRLTGTVQQGERESQQQHRLSSRPLHAMCYDHAPSLSQQRPLAVGRTEAHAAATQKQRTLGLR